MVKCKMSETYGVGPGRKDASKLGGRLGWLIAAGTLRAGGIFGPSLAFVLSFSKSFSADSETFKNIVLLTPHTVRTHRVSVVYFLILSTHVFSEPCTHSCWPSQDLSVDIFKISYYSTENNVCKRSFFFFLNKIRLTDDDSPDFLRFEWRETYSYTNLITFEPYQRNDGHFTPNPFTNQYHEPEQTSICKTLQV